MSFRFTPPRCVDEEDSIEPISHDSGLFAVSDLLRFRGGCGAR